MRLGSGGEAERLIWQVKFGTEDAPTFERIKKVGEGWRKVALD